MTNAMDVATEVGAARATYCEAITLGDALRRAAERTPDREALVMPEGRWTFRELRDAAEEIARSLAGLGIPKGAHVGVLIPNSFECLTAMLGIAMAGCVIVPINARFRPPEIAYIVENADLAAVLTSDLVDDHVDFAAHLTTALPGLDAAANPLELGLEATPALRSVVMLGSKEPAGFVGREAFRALAADVEPAEIARRGASLSLRSPAMILYTSGTTAQPRGCIISHESLVRVWGGVAAALELTDEDRMWNPCPMFHIAAIGVSIACILSGATIITTRYIDNTTSVELLAAERATAMFPAYAEIMLGITNHERYDEIDMSVTRRILAVGPPKVLRMLQEKVEPATVVSTFGMTESCGCTVMHRLDDPIEARTETSGHPLAGLEVRITDPKTGEVLPPNTPGEIRVAGPMLFDGYYKDPERTAQAMEDGWLHTGDQGVLDDDGRLSFRGRLKDMLKVGGENVAPAQVEEHLMSHPAVQFAVVIALPDERLDQVPAAYVELKTGASATEEELIEYCRESLARFKVPRHIRFIGPDEWPKSATKVQKFRLQEMLCKELGLEVPA
jgi:acyl-CoA synthetase (AMP-forming)/AMP-acid ligase II